MTKVMSAVRSMGLRLLRRLRRAAQTVLFKYTGMSDVKRWADETNLYESWDARTAILASFVPPGATVLEFGAGRMVLPRYLPEGCVYIPTDLVDRGRNTIVCDLNAIQPPPFPLHDVAVFSGVLEYVHDLPRLISHLAEYCNTIVASYAVTDIADQKNMISRRRRGWVNDWSSQEFQNLFLQNGFRCEQVAMWESQQLFKFVICRSK